MSFAITVMTWAIVAAAVITTVFMVNMRKVPLSLPSAKPTLAFFPKYYISLPLSEGRPERLKEILEEKGLKANTDRSGKTVFERGSVLGDFSIKWTKLRISQIEGRPGRLSITYGGPALFDTGDLWKFAKELETFLASPE